MDVLPTNVDMSKIFNNFDGSDSSMTPDRVEYVNWGEEGKDWHL